MPIESHKSSMLSVYSEGKIRNYAEYAPLENLYPLPS